MIKRLPGGVRMCHRRYRPSVRIELGPLSDMGADDEMGLLPVLKQREHVETSSCIEFDRADEASCTTTSHLSSLHVVSKPGRKECT